jgi:putative phosphoribosyl transferase
VLAQHLGQYAGRAEVIVLGLPRGGVPVAYEVARELRAPLDVFIVRKLGVPGFPELAMGAIASGGVRVLNQDVISQLPDVGMVLQAVTDLETEELQRREAQYRAGQTAHDLRDKTVILVDDGLATGATMRAAVEALKKHAVGRCVVAVPVAAPETCADLRSEVDEIVCATTPTTFYGVGQFYENFSQTSDEQVRALLARATRAEESRS